MKSAGLEAVRAVVFGVVHEFGDAVAIHLLGGIRAQQGFQKLRLKAVRFQPPLIMFRPKYHRHPVVDGGDHRIWFGGDDGERLDDLTGGRFGVIKIQFAGARRTNPFFPEASHAEDACIFHCKAEGLLAGWSRLPFVKAIGWNQAALLFERATVARFIADGVGAGVGKLVADFFILRPGRDEAPTHWLQGGSATFP